MRTRRTITQEIELLNDDLANLFSWPERVEAEFERIWQEEVGRFRAGLGGSKSNRNGGTGFSVSKQH